MATAFLTVNDALVALLQQAPAIAGARVYTGRARPLPTEHASSVNVSLEAIRGRQFAIGDGPMDWDVTYGIEIRARGSATVDAVAAVDPLLEAVFARVAGGTPPAGVLGWVLDTQIRVEVEEADTPIASLQLALAVQLRTQAGSLALAS